VKQVAVLGMDNFGRASVNELLEMRAEVLVVDKDRELIDSFKDSPVTAVELDVMNEENLRRVLPEKLDAVIVDMGKRLEASILATSYCVKMKVPDVVAVAETAAHGEILSLVGATSVIFPNVEAARRLTHRLMSKSFLNYTRVDDTLAIAELVIPAYLVGKKLRDSRLRQDFEANLLFVRKKDGPFSVCGADYVFQAGDIGLLAGSDESLNKLGGTDQGQHELGGLVKRVLHLFHHDSL